MFSKHFIIKDPETEMLYTVEIPDTKKHEIIRSERNSEYIQRLFDEAKDSLKLNYKRVKAHGNDNKVASDILVKWALGYAITPKEYDFLKNTAIGNLKLLGIIPLELTLPGSTITLPIIFGAASKSGINLFPDAWKRIRAQRKKGLQKLPSEIKRNETRRKLEDDILRYSGERPLDKTEDDIELENRIKYLDKRIKRPIK